MKRSQELTQAAVAERVKAEAIAGKNCANIDSLTDEQLAEATGYINEANRLDAEAANAERDEAAAEARKNALRAGIGQLAKSAMPPATLAVIRGNGAGFDGIEVGVNRLTLDPKAGFASGGEFFAAVRSSRTGAGTDRRLELWGAAAGMTAGDSADGGFLIPPEFSQTIWDGLNNGARNLLAECDQLTVTGESLTIPANAETSRANGSRYGGIRSYWVPEGGTITTSQPTFRALTLRPRKMAALIPVTSELLGAVGALEGYLSNAVTEEFAFMAGDAIINGDGVGKPVGVLGTGNYIEVAKESGQTAATINYTNCAKMYARMHPRALAGARWKINQDCWASLLTMVDPGNRLVFQGPNASIADAPNGTIFGLPIDPIEQCATLGTVGDIILGNFRYYAAGIKGGIETAVSIHVYFASDQSCFRFTTKLDGQPYLRTAQTPAKGSNTLGAFVALGTRA